MGWSLSTPTVEAVRGEDAVRSTLFWQSDGPFLRHPRRGGLGQYESLRLDGISRTLARRDAGSTRLRAFPGLPLRKPGLRRRPARRTPPPRGGARPGTRRRGALHRLRDARHQRRGICASIGI